jgi:hypothetical protein
MDTGVGRAGLHTDFMVTAQSSRRGSEAARHWSAAQRRLAQLVISISPTVYRHAPQPQTGAAIRRNLERAEYPVDVFHDAESAGTFFQRNHDHPAAHIATGPLST